MPGCCRKCKDGPIIRVRPTKQMTDSKPGDDKSRERYDGPIPDQKSDAHFQDERAGQREA